MSSRQLDEKYDQIRNQKLAHELEISPDELSELDYEIDENTSSDGLVYGYVIRFSDASPERILKKINGIDNNEVSLGPNAFD